jgi:hypothetical protein
MTLVDSLSDFICFILTCDLEHSLIIERTRAQPEVVFGSGLNRGTEKIRENSESIGTKEQSKLPNEARSFYHCTVP